MRVIYSERQTGRTTELIKQCAAAEERGEVSYIVCHSREEAWRIGEKAKELNKKIGFPITFDEFQHGMYSGRYIKNLYIDNADILLQQMTPVRIRIITLEKGPDDGIL